MIVLPSVVFSVKVDEELLKEFERLIRRDGFVSRNQAVVFLIKLYVEVKSEKSVVRRLLNILL